jgi:hypothetical protein
LLVLYCPFLQQWMKDRAKHTTNNRVGVKDDAGQGVLLHQLLQHLLVGAVLPVPAAIRGEGRVKHTTNVVQGMQDSDTVGLWPQACRGASFHTTSCMMGDCDGLESN